MTGDLGAAVLALTIVGKPLTEGHSTPPLLMCSARGVGREIRMGLGFLWWPTEGEKGVFVPPRWALNR
jgi:hypothetical protein